MVGNGRSGGRRSPWRIAGGTVAAVAAMAALAVPFPRGAIETSTAGPDETEPLELVAVDVSRFPRVVFDVALPEHELPSDVRRGAFELPGATDVVVEAHDPGSLTLAVVLDDGPAVPPAAIALQQGAANELVLNLPRRVELMVTTTSGVQIGPSTDRAEAMLALASARPGPDRASLGDAMIETARRLRRVDDPRRQLIVLTGDGADITAFESTTVTAALDRAEASIRVVAIGAPAGSNLIRTAIRSGGAAIGVDPDPAAAVRAIDVLTATFTDQYRVVATMAAAGSQVVRLSVEGRTYETVVPGLGPQPTLPPSSAPTSSSAPTTTGPPVTLGPSVVTPGEAPATPPATTARTFASVPGTPADSTRAPSPVAAAEMVVALAGIGLIVAVVMRRRRSSSPGAWRPAVRPPASGPRRYSRKK